MTALSGEKRTRPAPQIGEIERLKQLVAIQTQIVELAKQNELTKQECETLRRELAEKIRRARGERSAPAKLLRGIVKRLRNAASRQTNV
jgi:hypothetical protein